ncbi:SDR family oxidoreductase [Nakamurella silvestris]|nr:SDR family oxidoreductase [Nakamurella silvestris]
MTDNSLLSRLFDLDGRQALVTGSSRGLGAVMATGLAEAGARVVLHGRDPGQLAVTADLITQRTGTRPGTVSFDVTDPAAVAAGINELVDSHGIPDILVNNAGIQRRAPIAEFDTADWDDVIASNLSSAFYVTRGFLPGMVSRGSGKIINIASVQSQLARQTIAPYSASKGGLVMLTKGMAADLARHNIQVNALSPGYFATEMNTALTQNEEFSAWVRQRTPAGRWGRVDELIGTLIYLASDASSFVSGQNIFVDGGMTAVV